jgi:1-acyl-sn-glycerol-3-phosphate acyltransferase
MALPCGPLLYLVIVPLSWVRPDRRRQLVSWYMKLICRGILAGFRLGGARFDLGNRLPTDRPTLIIGNHQSLLDIVLTTLIADPIVPAFVPRIRYARFVPLVSRCIAMLGCPIVDPKRDPRGAVEVIRQAAAREPYALVIYPEGHRTRDGEIREFRTTGLQAILETRSLPVYLLVSDGLWKARRLVDFVFNVHHLRSRSVVLGPFEPPPDPAGIPAAVAGWRALMVERLHQLRNETRA